MKTFQINNYLSLVLKNRRIVVYAGKEEYRNSRLIFWDISEHLFGTAEDPSPESHFKDYCTHFQTWADSNYNLRLLHLNALDTFSSFRLLEQLMDAGDLKARKAFKEEFARRFREAPLNEKASYMKDIYFNLNFFTREELEVLLENFDVSSLLKLNMREAFQLLDKLAFLGNKEAENILKEDVLEAFKNGDPPRRLMILQGGNLRFFSEQQLNDLFAECPIDQLAKTYSEFYLGGHMDSFPSYLMKFTNLRKFSMKHSSFRTLPDFIGKLTKLEELKLTYNHFTELPESMKYLRSLKHLYLDKNEFQKFPDVLTELTNLETLSLGWNRLETLPESIGNLKNLKILFLEGNNLKELPESVGDFSRLKKLDLNDNNLKELPESIGNLSRLKILYLGKNSLETLPNSIGNLTHLERLEIFFNRLSKLPKSMGNLNNLRALYLRDNQFNNIPEYIRTLPKLHETDFEIDSL